MKLHCTCGLPPKSETLQERMEWIRTAQGAPFFETNSGEAWTPVGHNDALTWPTLRGTYRRRAPEETARYLAMLAAHGVTVLRIMLEYNQTDYRYFELSPGKFNPHLIRFWDDLLELCEQYGIRVLLTPFDTFWMWIRWRHHPYNRRSGGPLTSIRRLLLEQPVRDAIKRRLEFATERWGHLGVIFAWDLWNEIHPAMAEDTAEPIYGFIEEVSVSLREHELRLHGRAHLQTVSIFGPIGLQNPVANQAVLRHHCLDFASTHFYEEGTIDDPRNTVDAAVSTGKLMRDTLRDVSPERPFFDSESGPIHAFKDRHKSLPEPFDDEYFRHMQWAHFASGGAGGGMRWPNRHPHILTCGMHRAQQSLSAFLPFLDWRTFRRSNWNQEVNAESRAQLAIFACGDRTQALVWLLRRDSLDSEQRVRCAPAARVTLTLPAMEPGAYTVTLWDTAAGAIHEQRSIIAVAGPLQLTQVSVPGDIAIAVTRDR